MPGPGPWSEIVYFKPEEFDSPDKSGTGMLMQPDFILKLDRIRKRVGFAMVVTSGYRTQQHNFEVGGKSGGVHCHGEAADLSILTSAQRFKLVKAALAEGINRIGIGPNFVHLDDDHEAPQGVIWTY